MADYLYIILIALPLGLVTFSTAFWGGIFKCLCFTDKLKMAAAFGLINLGLFWLGTYSGNAFANSLGWLAVPFAEAMLLLTGVKVIFGSLKARPEQKNYDLAKIGELLAVSFASGLNAFLIGLGYGLLRTASEGMLIIILFAVGIFAALGAYWGQKNGRIIYTTFAGIIAGVLIVALAAVLAIEFFEVFKN